MDNSKTIEPGDIVLVTYDRKPAIHARVMAYHSNGFVILPFDGSGSSEHTDSSRVVLVSKWEPEVGHCVTTTDGIKCIIDHVDWNILDLHAVNGFGYTRRTYKSNVKFSPRRFGKGSTVRNKDGELETIIREEDLEYSGNLIYRTNLEWRGEDDLSEVDTTSEYLSCLTRKDSIETLVISRQAVEIDVENGPCANTIGREIIEEISFPCIRENGGRLFYFQDDNGGHSPCIGTVDGREIPTPRWHTTSKASDYNAWSGTVTLFQK